LIATTAAVCRIFDLPANTQSLIVDDHRLIIVITNIEHDNLIIRLQEFMFFSCSLYFSLPVLEFPASYRSVWLILAACALIFALSKRSAPEDSFS